MTPTEELRHMLDERGVEYTADDGEHAKRTCWPYMGELMAMFVEYDNGTTRFACDTWCFTPAQAIAATLGTGTCHNASEYPRMFFCCSECGCAHKRSRPYVDMPRFCPDRGRKVAK